MENNEMLKLRAKILSAITNELEERCQGDDNDKLIGAKTMAYSVLVAFGWAGTRAFDFISRFEMEKKDDQPMQGLQEKA